MALTYKDYILNENTVEEISADLKGYMDGFDMERRSALRLRLTVEELLLNIMSGCGRDLPVKVGMGRHFGKRLLRIRYVSAPFDPTRTDENDWSHQLMKSLGFFPSWTCRGRTNTVSLVLAEKEKRSTLVNILLAVMMAVLLGAAGRMFPEGLRQGIDEVLLVPVSQGFLGLMSTFSGLLIAFTICHGILGAGDSMTLEKLGKHVISRYVGISFAISMLTSAVLVPVLKLNWSGRAQSSTSQLKSISEMVFGILPSNPVEPFSTGNALQIIVIALFVGIGLLAIGERGSRIRDLIDESATLTQHIISIICGLIPLFVFTMLLRQIWSGRAQTLLSIGRMLLMIVVVEFLLAAGFWLGTAIRLKCPPILLLRKVLPAFIIAFTTASSMSALTLSMETCIKKLGAEENTVSFAYPLGTVMYMPSSIATFTIIAFSLAEIFQVEINPSWIISAVITVTLLVIALPPIPGAGLLVYTILFAQLGIPAEAFVMVTAIDVVIDFYDTGLNVLLLMLRVACEADALGKLNRAVLLRP